MARKGKEKPIKDRTPDTSSFAIRNGKALYIYICTYTFGYKIRAIRRRISQRDEEEPRALRGDGSVTSAASEKSNKRVIMCNEKKKNKGRVYTKTRRKK